jgi:hypothetical protein
MRVALLLIAFAAGCGDSPTGGNDLAVGDLAAGDLPLVMDLPASVDLTPLPDLSPVGDGGMCDTPTALTAGVKLDSQSTTAAADDYRFGPGISAACQAELGTNGYSGRDVSYSFTIPAGKTLTVTVEHTAQPDGIWYPAVAIVTDCSRPKTSCLAAKDTVIPNANPRVVSYANTSGGPLPVIIIVDSYHVTSYGEFAITAATN